MDLVRLKAPNDKTLGIFYLFFFYFSSFSSTIYGPQLPFEHLLHWPCLNLQLRLYSGLLLAAAASAGEPPWAAFSRRYAGPPEFTSTSPPRARPGTPSRCPRTLRPCPWATRPTCRRRPSLSLWFPARAPPALTTPPAPVATTLRPRSPSR